MTIDVRLEILQKIGDDWRWVPEIKEFQVEEAFSLDENIIDAEVCRMGQLLLEYGSIQADLQTQAARKKTDVDYVGSLIAQQLRASGEKLTESAIKERVTVTDEFRMAVMEYQAADGDAIKFTNYFKSLLKKADLIIALTYKLKAENRNF